MRIGVVALQHETNTFTEAPTDLEAFRGGLLATGDAFRDAVEGSNHELAGFFAGLDEAGVAAVPLFGARALPYGLVSDDAYAELKRRLLAEVRGHLPLDGLLLAPHGAGVSEAARDLDGDWLQAVRELVGPEVPIVATGDPHANLSPRMVDAVDAIIAYGTNPHVDQRERGLEAARLLVDRLHGKVTPHMAAVFPPLGISIDKQCTDEAPLAPLMERIDAVRQRREILTASLWQGFPYADVQEMGAAVTVVSDRDPAAAQREANGIALALWEMRAELQVDLPNVPDTVERAQRLPPPVCLLDVGDNVGGGSAGDGTALAAELERRGGGKSFVCIYDPESVAAAEAAGTGTAGSFRIGGKTDRLHGDTLVTECRILDLFDGRFYEPEIRHGGVQHYDQGRTALVESSGGVTIMLTSKRVVPVSLHQLTDFGIDPGTFRCIVAKGVNAPLAAYREVCPSFIRVDTPGSTAAAMTGFDFRHRRRPMYPFEPDLRWPP
jgi:microcystin degradation protein MlrC